MTSTVIYEGELRTVATHLHSGTVIETDAPLDNQGKAERFSPSDLLATSLGSCMLTIMGIKARDLQVDIRGTKIDIQKFMKPDPRRVVGIDLTFYFPYSLQGLNEKHKTILERAAHSCPVIYSIHPDIELNIRFHWDPVVVTEGE
jgi:putative redox protein